MKEVRTINSNYIIRMNEILDLSWMIFKSQFINHRHEINKEASFQHHFAQIIRSVGNLYSIKEKDLFKVDLETKCTNIREKSKYIDITCEFVDEINCAIELKFKTAIQGAQDHGRIDVYSDIESLELVSSENYNFGKFYMITDSKTYINKSKIGVGTIFSIHDGFISQNNKELFCNSKGREYVRINLKNSYEFKWEKIDKWYFLKLDVNINNNLK